MIGESIKIRNCNLKNRIVMPPMAQFIATNGMMKPEMIKHYIDRADHLGMITVESVYVLDHDCGSNHANLIGMYKENIPSFKELTTKVHEKNCSIIVQISHGGIKSISKPVGPSNIDITGKNKEIEVLTKERIQEICDSFIQAAIVAKEGGFDGVEVHCAHGFLLNQFYSPISNKRTDEYGGSVENRIRLTCDIVKGIRKALGEDFMISVRLGVIDYDMDGNKMEDAISACKLLEDAGSDMISVSGGLNGITRKTVKDEGYFRDASSEIKKVVKIPVLLTGGIVTKEGAEKLLQSKACDLIGIGRPLLKNANYVKEM